MDWGVKFSPGWSAVRLHARTRRAGVDEHRSIQIHPGSDTLKGVLAYGFKIRGGLQPFGGDWGAALWSAWDRKARIDDAPMSILEGDSGRHRVGSGSARHDRANAPDATRARSAHSGPCEGSEPKPKQWPNGHGRNAYIGCSMNFYVTAAITRHYYQHRTLIIFGSASGPRGGSAKTGGPSAPTPRSAPPESVNWCARVLICDCES